MGDALTDEQRAEAAYGAMYDARDRYAVKPCDEDACLFFGRAIAEAERVKQPAEVKRLTDRLAHVQAVYNSQFR